MQNAGLIFEGVCRYTENKNLFLHQIFSCELIFGIWMQNAGLIFEGVCRYAENENQVMRQIPEIN